MSMNGAISVFMVAYKAVKIAAIFLVVVGFMLTVSYFCLWYLLIQRQKGEEHNMMHEVPAQIDSKKGGS